MVKMLVSKNLAVNEQGHLTVGGMDTVELAKEYGTPLYIMDEGLIREHCRSFRESMDKYYGGQGLVCYASKAFCCKAMCRIMLEEGLGLDVVSEGELYSASTATTRPTTSFPMPLKTASAELLWIIFTSLSVLTVLRKRLAGPQILCTG